MTKVRPCSQCGYTPHFDGASVICTNPRCFHHDRSVPLSRWNYQPYTMHMEYEIVRLAWRCRDGGLDCNDKIELPCYRDPDKQCGDCEELCINNYSDELKS